MSAARLPSRDPSALCPAEKRVLALVGQGLSNSEIGDELLITNNTVRCYMKRLHEKLDIQGRSRLAVWASKAEIETEASHATRSR